MSNRTARRNESKSSHPRPETERAVASKSLLSETKRTSEPLACGGALHSFPKSNQAGRPALILCHGFAQNISAFTFPTRSLVHHVGAAGFAPYILELPVPRGERAERLQGQWDGLSHYANVVAPQALERVYTAHNQVAWLGHSMGGIIGLCVPQRYSQQIAALVSVGSPLLPAIPGGKHANQLLFRCARALAGTGVPLPGKSLARKLQRWSSWLDHPTPGSIFPLQLWSPRSLQPNEIQHALHKAFDDDSWAALADLIEMGLSDGMRAGSLHVDERLKAWRAPTLVVAGAQDRLVPPRSARLLFERLPNAPKLYFEVGEKTTGRAAGHIDVLMGAHAEKCVWPRIMQFLQEHLAQPKAPRITPR